MSTSTAKRKPGSAPHTARRSPRARRRRLRRRLLFVFFTVVAGFVAMLSLAPWADRAVQEVKLPLRHDDIIRQQAAEKDLDPALIAAVIFVESRYRDQTSPAGAKGLMQIMPKTAQFIAYKSGGTAFVQGDLATPQVNISYGSWYLRYLLDHYDGSVEKALSAYNGGLGNVDRWVARARARGERFSAARDVEFAETRDYVRRVFDARKRYRSSYPNELGI